MSNTILDSDLWEQIKSTITPLKNKKVIYQTQHNYILTSKKLLAYTIDLHGYTIQEAYNNLVKFISKHFEYNTRYIIVITGKGMPDKEGLIHKEICNWFSTRKFDDYIKSYEWINGNGALKVYLKRKK